MGLRALELGPTLGARYVAARAAWRLQDWTAVEVEMTKVRDQAHEQGEQVIEALALTALGEAMLKRHGDCTEAKKIVDNALELLAGKDDPVAHFEALSVRAHAAGWLGEMEDTVRFMERAYVIALDAGRKDLQTIAAQILAQTHILRLELDEAELLLTRALELAGESGSVRARVGATLSYGWFLTLKGELDAAETLFEEVRASSVELGVEPAVAAALAKLGWIARLKGDFKRAEKLHRESLRITETRGDLGVLPDQQAALAETLADLGKIDEAERLALDARSNAGVRDTSAQVAAATALAAVRAAQGRRPEAEQLLDSALALARDGDFKVFELEPLARMIDLQRAAGRNGASPYEARLAELTPMPSSTARIA